MKWIVMGVLAGLLAGSTWGAQLLQYSDETDETILFLPSGFGAFVEFDMPIWASTITDIRIFVANTSNEKKFGLAVYDANRKWVWSRETTVVKGWVKYSVGTNVPRGAKFYAGVVYSLYPYTAGLGCDTTAPHHLDRMWVRRSNDTWELSTETYDFMIGVYVAPTPAVAATSLGRIRAVYR